MEVKASADTFPGKLVVSLPPSALLFIDDQPTQASVGDNTFYTVPLPPGAARYYRVRGEVSCDGQPLEETVTAVVQPGREAWVSFPRLQRMGEAPRNEPLIPCRSEVIACQSEVIAGLSEGQGPPAATLGFEPVGYTAAEEPVLELPTIEVPAVQAPTVQALRAKFVVAVPAGASLLVQGQPLEVVSGENIFHSPPLQVGRPYRYTLRAEVTRDGQIFAEEVEVVVSGGDEARVSFPHLQMPRGVAVRWPRWR
jgi:uncharacterized protein (TIGR03000 family)